MTTSYLVEVEVEVKEGWDESDIITEIQDLVDKNIDVMPMANNQYYFETEYSWEQNGSYYEADLDDVEGNFEDLDNDEDSE
jgi:hypothetical protein